MHDLRNLLFDNWILKLFALVLAAALWFTVASESTSEIGLEVPLEYRNVPRDSEILGDGPNSVEVRLRGPSALIRQVQGQDVSSTIDVAKFAEGERTVPLTAQNISAPFGIEVVSVTPSRVRLTLERTQRKAVPVLPVVVGEPARGFRVVSSSSVPESIEITGPATRVNAVERIETTPIDINGKSETMQTAVELELPDLVRLPQAGPVNVQVVIRPTL